MRSFTLLAVACWTASALASADQQPSIQALLERLSHKNIRSVDVESDKKARSLDEDDAARVERLLQRMNRNNVQKVNKRYIWGPSIINDGDANAPPVGANTNLFNNGYAAPTPNQQVPPPVFSALPTPKPYIAPQPSLSPDVQAFDASQAAAASQKNGVFETSSLIEQAAQPRGRTKALPSASQHSSQTPASSSVANKRTKQVPQRVTPTSMAKVRRDKKNKDAKTSSRDEVLEPTDRRIGIWARAAETPAARVKARLAKKDNDEDDELVVDEVSDGEDYYIVPADSITDILPEDALDSATGAVVEPSVGSDSLDEVEEDSDDEDDLKKRWIWATSIIQDSTPTSGLPPPGQNVNLLTSATTLSTPAATLVPNFLSSASAAVPTAANPVILSSAQRLASTTSSAKAQGRTKSATLVKVPRSHKVRHEAHHNYAKKWIQGPSIIQDGDAVPTSGYTYGNTPNANVGIDPPTFVPIAGVAAATGDANKVVAPTPVAQAASPTASDATLAAASAAPTSAATTQEKEPNWVQRQWSKFVTWWRNMFSSHKSSNDKAAAATSSTVSDAPAPTSSA